MYLGNLEDKFERVNDITQVVPYSNFKQKTNIIRGLERKREKGYPINSIRADDSAQIIIYTETHRVYI